jgi:hypothetical protein
LTGSQRWPATSWRTLLELALPALDSLGRQASWTFGGGTALALVLHHRISYDIDIFLEDARSLAALSPNRNPVTRAMSDRWQEPGHYIKLERPEGEIDFIVAARLTSIPPWLLRFAGRDIPVEAPAEILAKKLRYRASRLAVRDIFDLLAIHRHDPTAVALALEAAPGTARLAVDRIQRIAGRYRSLVRDEINPTPAGAELLELDPLDAARLLAGAAR